MFRNLKKPEQICSTLVKKVLIGHFQILVEIGSSKNKIILLIF